METFKQMTSLFLQTSSLFRPRHGSFLLAQQVSTVNIRTQMWAGDRKISSVSPCPHLLDYKRPVMNGRATQRHSLADNSLIIFPVSFLQISIVCLSLQDIWIYLQPNLLQWNIAFCSLSPSSSLIWGLKTSNKNLLCCIIASISITNVKNGFFWLHQEKANSECRLFIYCDSLHFLFVMPFSDPLPVFVIDRSFRKGSEEQNTS